MSILVVDNGGGNIKAGLDHFDQPLSIANVTGKIPKSMQYLVSDQVYDSRSDSQLSLSRPYDRGYLNNWQCEIDIWTYLLNQPTLKGLTPAEASLVLTEPPLNPVSLQNCNEVVFEYFGFKEYVRRPAAWFSMYEFSHNKEWNKGPSGTSGTSGNSGKSGNSGNSGNAGLNSCTVVDSGFSFTHSLPFINQFCQKSAVSRSLHPYTLTPLFPYTSTSHRPLRPRYMIYDICFLTRRTELLLHQCSHLLCSHLLSHHLSLVPCQIRRVNVGGKLLTNYLKELVSYRQWNMMDEFLLMNQVQQAQAHAHST
jgi:actin-related protein